MGNPPSNSGLKGQWGVGDPAAPNQGTSTGSTGGGGGQGQSPSSDRQRQEFQSAFQGLQGEINGHLQYTAANAEASKNSGFTTRRDTLYTAFQGALAKIDPKDESKAQGDINRVLADARALGTEVAAFRQETEKAKNDWDSRQASYDEAVKQVEELVAWEDAKAPALRALVDGIRNYANKRQHAQASTTLDQLLPKLAPIYQEYLRQKEAKPQYEQLLAEQSARLEPLKTAERPSQPMTAKAGEADAALQDAKGKADTKDFVAGVAGMEQFKGLVDELDTLTNDPQRQQYLADSQGAAQTSEPQPEPAFKTLEPDWAAIGEAGAKAQPLADAGDYAGANQALADAQTRREELLRKREDLVQQKQQYEEALAQLQPRLAAVSVSEAGYEALESMLQELSALQSEMQASAEAEDFAKALAQAGDLSGKVDTIEQAKAEIDQKKQEYESGWAALQPRVQAISKSDPKYTEIEPQLQEIAQTQTAMEAAAQGKDYVQAAQQLQDLSAKVDAYEQAMKEVDDKPRLEYEAAAAAVKANVEDCLVMARSYPPLDADKQAVANMQQQMEAAAKAGDYDKAKQLATELGTKADAYLKKAGEEQKKYDDKGAEIGKALDDANYFSRDDVARDYANSLSKDEIKFLPTEVRNRLMEEMQGGNFSADDKAAIDKLYSVRCLDPEFEKAEKKHRDQLLEALRNDPAIAKARTDWPTLTQEDRVKLMEKVAKYHCDAYGTDSSTMKVETYNKEPKKDADGNVTSWNNGAYNHSTGTLQINTNPYWDASSGAGVKINDFDLALDLATHESGHRYQETLADRVRSGEIKPGDPEYNQAVAFKLNSDYYVQPDSDYGVYENQPMEAHSRISGHAIDEAHIGK